MRESMQEFDVQVKSIISQLELEKHPEGGYFKETYRSGEITDTAQGKRNISTAIYYLLDSESISHLHRIKSDEMWHFYIGSPLRLVILNEKTGAFREIILSNDLENNSTLQFVVPAGVWMAAEVIDKSSFSLVGCTVSPGFDFRDFEMADDKVLDSVSEELKDKLVGFICKD